MKPTGILFFRMTLIFSVLVLFAQTDFPGGQYSNADTSVSSSPATTCWGKRSIHVRSSAIAGIPELKAMDGRFSFRFKSVSLGLRAGTMGTFFQRKSFLTFLLGHRSQNIAAGMGVELNNYFIQEYYSFWMPQLALYSTARLWKGKAWFSMDIKNVFPLNRSGIQESLGLIVSGSYRIFKAYSTGLQFQWFDGNPSQLSWLNTFRWNKHLSHFTYLHFPTQIVEMGIRISSKRNSVLISGTMFYSPGVNWTCGYSYCW